jgi:hypothetical protein
MMELPDFLLCNAIRLVWTGWRELEAVAEEPWMRPGALHWLPEP